MAVLRWVCDVCDEPIVDGAGSLMSTASEHNGARAAIRQWQSEHADGGYSGSDLLSMPDRAKWRVFHDSCEGGLAVEVAPYNIGLHRVRTTDDLLAWTAHLMEKAWLPFTDWSDLIGRHAPTIPQ